MFCSTDGFQIAQAVQCCFFLSSIRLCVSSVLKHDLFVFCFDTLVSRLTDALYVYESQRNLGRRIRARKFCLKALINGHCKSVLLL